MKTIASTIALGLLSYCTCGVEERATVLVGYGCDGEIGPMVAQYEDQFPQCDRIEPRHILILPAA